MSDPESIAENIVQAILADVTDRRGWRQEWDGFDDDVQEEILDKWRVIVSHELNR